MTVQWPSDVKFGYVADRVLVAVGDTTADPDRLPDAVPARGFVRFSPKQPFFRTDNGPASVAKSKIDCAVNQDPSVPGEVGMLIDAAGAVGTVALIVGHYDVEYRLENAYLPPAEIVVKEEHTESEPLWVPRVAELIPGPTERFVVNEQVYLDTLAAMQGAETAQGAAEDARDTLLGMIQDGTPGPEGASAYEVWLDSGGVGSEGDFLASLKGDKGDPFVYADFTPSQLAALKGDKGDPFTYSDFTGPQLDGLKGDKGDAFVYADFTPSQLAALKGDKGDEGPKWTQSEVQTLVDNSLGPVDDVLDSILNGGS